MTRDREIAQAISEGINCIYAIANVLRTTTAPIPDPAWPGTLREMERALEGVMANEVWTSVVVSEEQRDRIHEVSAFVADWVSTGRISSQLLPAAVDALRLLGL